MKHSWFFPKSNLIAVIWETWVVTDPKSVAGIYVYEKKWIKNVIESIYKKYIWKKKHPSFTQ